MRQRMIAEHTRASCTRGRSVNAARRVSGVLAGPRRVQFCGFVQVSASGLCHWTVVSEFGLNKVLKDWLGTTGLSCFINQVRFEATCKQGIEYKFRLELE